MRAVSPVLGRAIRVRVSRIFISQQQNTQCQLRYNGTVTNYYRQQTPNAECSEFAAQCKSTKSECSRRAASVGLWAREVILANIWLWGNCRFSLTM